MGGLVKKVKIARNKQLPRMSFRLLINRDTSYSIEMKMSTLTEIIFYNCYSKM